MSLWEERGDFTDLDKWTEYQLNNDSTKLNDFKMDFLKNALIKDFEVIHPDESPAELLKSLMTLDVGCGAGNFAINNMQNGIGSIVLGIDQNEKCVEKAISNLKEKSPDLDLDGKPVESMERGLSFSWATLDDVLVNAEEEVK